MNSIESDSGNKSKFSILLVKGFKNIKIQKLSKPEKK